MSSLQVDNIQTYNSNPPVIKNVSGTEVGTFCRAWVNFNGSGTVAIRASFNVSSITDNGVGDYTVNFTNALVDANHNAVVSTSFGSNGYNFAMINTSSQAVIAAPTSSSIRFACLTWNGSAWNDPTYVHVAVFR